ncbi:hypothetical protein N7457_001568 [Penicillium paradoxum]|nr:uncharacterized protein N7457_001568 [Penicillium paradoxum]KAJ5794969.1 hypothetical protein N7457_001568 [Penicillium paradoxum]
MEVVFDSWGHFVNIDSDDKAFTYPETQNVLNTGKFIADAAVK